MIFQGMPGEMMEIWSRLAPDKAYLYGLIFDRHIFPNTQKDIGNTEKYIDILEKDTFSRHHKIKLNELKGIIQELKRIPGSFQVIKNFVAYDVKKGISTDFIISNLESIISSLEKKNYESNKNKREYEIFLDEAFKIMLKNFFLTKKENFEKIEEINNLLNDIKKIDEWEKIPDKLSVDDETCRKIIEECKKKYPVIDYEIIKLADIKNEITSIFTSIKKSMTSELLKDAFIKRPEFFEYAEHYDVLKDGIKNDIISHTEIPICGDVLISREAMFSLWAEKPAFIDVFKDSRYAVIYAAKDSTAGDILHKTVEAYIMMNLYNEKILPFSSFEATASGLVTLMEENIFTYTPGNESGTISMKREAHISHLKDKLMLFSSAMSDILLYIDGRTVKDIISQGKDLGIQEKIIENSVFNSLIYPMKAFASVCSYLRLRKEYDKILKLNPEISKDMFRLFSEIHDMPGDMFSSRLKNLIALHMEENDD